METYSLDFVQEEIQLGNDTYIIREASAAATREYNRQLLEGSTVTVDKGNDDGPQSVKLGSGSAGSNIVLVSKCLYKQVKDKEGNPVREEAVSAEKVANFPDRIVDLLADKIKKLSPSFSDEATDETVKN